LVRLAGVFSCQIANTVSGGLIPVRASAGLAQDAISRVVQQDNEPLPADDEVGC